MSGFCKARHRTQNKQWPTSYCLVKLWFCLVDFNRLDSNYALLLPNKGAKSRLRGIKQKKTQIIPPEPRLGSFV